jgi:hypothetical protein
MEQTHGHDRMMHLEDYVARADEMAAGLPANADIATMLDRLHAARDMAARMAREALDEDQAVSAIETIHADLQHAQHLGERIAAAQASKDAAMARLLRHIASIDLGHAMVGPWPISPGSEG